MGPRARFAKLTAVGERRTFLAPRAHFAQLTGFASGSSLVPAHGVLRKIHRSLPNGYFTSWRRRIFARSVLTGPYETPFDPLAGIIVALSCAAGLSKHPSLLF